MDKKGQGISMTYIIIALLALVVLVVIVLFFYGGMEVFTGRTKTVGETSEQQLSIWRGQCKLYCGVDQKAFCEHIFEGEIDKEGDIKNIYICNDEFFIGDDSKYTGQIEDEVDLKVPCENIKSVEDCV